MCKNLTTRALLKLKYEVNVVIPMEHPKPSPHIVAPIDTRICKAQNEGITQPHGIERMVLEEEIQHGNLRLHKLEEERVQLRKKSSLMDGLVKKMEDEIKKYFLRKNVNGKAWCV